MLHALLSSFIVFQFVNGLTMTVTQLAAIQHASPAAFSAAAILAGTILAVGGHYFQKEKVIVWVSRRIEAVAVVSVAATALGAAVLMWGTPDARILVGATFLVIFTIPEKLYWEIIKMRTTRGDKWEMKMQSNSAAAGLAGSCTYFALLMVGWEPSLGVALILEVVVSVFTEVMFVIVFKKYKGPTEK
jgi:hypothetical protein